MRFGLFVPQGWRLDLVGIDKADQWDVMRGFAEHADRSRFESVSKDYSVSGKICRSGLNETVVPVSLVGTLPISRSGCVIAPRSKPIS